MMKKKVTLACQECHSKNYYENKSSVDKRLIKRKFCKQCVLHTIHKEEK
ncbi:MAG: 50S ribosomal protein L33 [Mycoplasmataceae bacterium]|nr:50S ribosomal protein L33 [Mycoplasmataceae bacterium]